MSSLAQLHNVIKACIKHLYITCLCFATVELWSVPEGDPSYLSEGVQSLHSVKHHGWQQKLGLTCFSLFCSLLLLLNSAWKLGIITFYDLSWFCIHSTSKYYLRNHFYRLQVKAISAVRIVLVLLWLQEMIHWGTIFYVALLKNIFPTSYSCRRR